MKPKEKAKELVNKFWYIQINTLNKGKIKKFANLQLAKQCALICVDEIYNLPLNFIENKASENTRRSRIFWQKVKQEINNL